MKYSSNAGTFRRAWRVGLTAGLAVALSAAFIAGDAHAQRPGFVLELNGDGQRIITDASAGSMGVAGAAAKTVEAWAYTTVWDDSAAIFAFGAPGTSGHDYAFRVRGGENQWRAQFWGGDLDFDFPSHEQWVHFAIAYTGTQAIAYANGQQVGTLTRELDTAADNPFRIGWWPHRGEDQTFGGKIAEVRVWNRALSAAEIQGNMHRSLNGDEAGLVGYWPLNTSSGTTAPDLAGGNDGTFEGSPAWVFEWPFVQDLTSRIVSQGQAVTLGPVQVYAPEGDVSYQWYLDGDAIPGATESSYTIGSAVLADAGVYHVVADDDRDQTPVQSAQAQISVWENLPVGGAAGLILLGAGLAGAGAWVARRNRA